MIISGRSCSFVNGTDFIDPKFLAAILPTRPRLNQYETALRLILTCRAISALVPKCASKRFNDVWQLGSIGLYFFIKLFSPM